MSIVLWVLLLWILFHLIFFCTWLLIYYKEWHPWGKNIPAIRSAFYLNLVRRHGMAGPWIHRTSLQKVCPNSRQDYLDFHPALALSTVLHKPVTKLSIADKPACNRCINTRWCHSSHEILLKVKILEILIQHSNSVKKPSWNKFRDFENMDVH